MALTIGTQLGSYEITQLLGKGGMGEVYRARDTRLGRDVAIKSLPEIFASDSERVARFEREAKILATLNHPNVAAIYGFEKTDRTPYLVLELVEGETLAERISRGPIAAKDALQIARQVADALESAHEKGVIHRDLKPANIKITPEGKVKVLDFGLAKAFSSEQPNTQLSQSPTLSIAATNAGVILGTAAYMSPEQAKGSLSVDARSDIFSFGCVLYEMLTGRQVFYGETIPEVLASVLAREPDFARLSPELNPRLHELVQRCLAKDLKKRWHAAGDFRFEIETILTDPRGIEFRARPATRWLTGKVVAVALAALLIGALIAAAVLPANRPATYGELTRFPFVLPDGQSLSGSPAKMVALSPDGKSLIYTANRQLYLRRMAEMQSHRIPGSESASNPVFSPDGQWIAFFQFGDLRKIAISGGASVKLCSISGPPYGLSWVGDTIVLAQGSEGIFAVSENGGKLEQWIKLEPGEVADSPQILPGGKVLVSVTKVPGPDRWDKADVVVFTRGTGHRNVLIQGGAGARYLPTGHLLYTLGSNIMAVRFDLQQLKVIGGPVSLVEGILRIPNFYSSSSGNFDVSTNGTLVYVPSGNGSAVGQRVIAVVTRNGKSDPLRLPPGSYDNLRVSKDGKQLALTTSDDGLNTIWIYELSGTTSLRRLTLEGSNNWPRWSPDGRRLALFSTREGKSGLFLHNSDGTGASENLTTVAPADAQLPWSFDPAGKILVFTTCKNLFDCGIFTIPVEGERKIQTFVDEPLSAQYNATFSPDGRWIAYVSSEGPTRTRHIYVQQFPAGAKYQISREPSEAPAWSPDGKELFYYQTESAKLVTVSIQTLPSFSFGDPVVLPIERMIQATGNPRQYDVLPDGRFLILQTASQAAESHPTQEIHVVLNWFRELQERVPVK
jgi:serine/threonine-protein kinase